MGRRKPYIDKRHSTTYSLTCEDSSQEQPTQQPDSIEDHDHGVSTADRTPGKRHTTTGGLSEQERQEVLELGLPDDGYNYLQHIRDPAGTHSGTKDVNEEGVHSGFEGNASHLLYTLSVLLGKAARHQNTACNPSVAGPKVFLPAPYLEPPPEDLKLFDARGLPLREAATDQVGWLCGESVFLLAASSMRFECPYVPTQQDLVHSFDSVTAFSREIDDQRPPKSECEAAL